jgi:hypothetical protein
MNQSDFVAAFVAEVRGIQGFYPKAHQALRNWGFWSRDRSGIFPCISKPSIWDEYDSSKADFAEEGEGQQVVQQTEVKQERAETPDFNEKEAVELDELLHDRFPYEIRKCLLVAYVTAEIPEEQFPRFSCCTHEGFLMSLTSSLHRIQEALE